MLTQPHLLLNTPHPDFDEERRGAYTRAKNKTRGLIHPRENLVPDSFYSSRFVVVVAVVFLLFLSPSLVRLSSPRNALSYLLPLLTFFSPRSSSRLFAFSSRGDRPLLRRRNVPIKSESHVLPISRQLNLVHAHIAVAIAATRALCQGTPANSADRRTLDEYSMPSS